MDLTALSFQVAGVVRHQGVPAGSSIWAVNVWVRRSERAWGETFYLVEAREHDQLRWFACEVDIAQAPVPPMVHSLVKQGDMEAARRGLSEYTAAVWTTIRHEVYRALWKHQQASMSDLRESLYEALATDRY